MKTTNHVLILGLAVSLCLAMSACANRSASPEKFGDEEGGDQPHAGKALEKEDKVPAPSNVAAKPKKVTLTDSSNAKVVKAKKFLDQKKYEELIGVIEPNEAQSLSTQDKDQLADLYHAAADIMVNKRKDLAFSSMFCERGLLVSPNHQGLLRLQVRNYLHPEMKLVGGAEELAEQLVVLDPEDLENQYLRGKVAFEQADWDTAVVWLKKAARVGRTQQGGMIDKAWKLLELAKGKAEETRSALSMTRELEVRMKRAQIKAKSIAVKGNDGDDDAGEGGVARPSGGKIVLYMTKWCKHCKKTADLLRSLNVKFEQRDIEKDQTALMEMMQAAAANQVEVRGVPVVAIGSKLVVGYNEALITSLVNKIR